MGHCIRHNPENYPEFLPAEEFHRRMEEIYEDPEYRDWLDALDNHSVECMEVDVDDLPF